MIDGTPNRISICVFFLASTREAAVGRPPDAGKMTVVPTGMVKNSEYARPAAYNIISFLCCQQICSEGLHEKVAEREISACQTTSYLGSRDLPGDPEPLCAYVCKHYHGSRRSVSGYPWSQTYDWRVSLPSLLGQSGAYITARISPAASG